MEQALQDMKRMMDACDPFEHVEEFIEGCDRLSEEERSVLWLIAWLDGELPWSRSSESPMQRHYNELEDLSDAGLRPALAHRVETRAAELRHRGKRQFIATGRFAPPV